MDLFKSCLGKIRNIRKGFTLTEILIALAVIAIIVVLVLPVVTSRAQNKSFALAYDAEVKEIFSSLEGLTLNENAKSFNDTMMNVSTEIAEGANAEEVASSALNGLTDTNPGLFLKKYTKVAKYCGATPGTCFAQAYFRYNGRRRGNFDFANIVTGNGNATYRVRGNENDLRYDNMACALLKNGMSLCISPQVTATNGDVLRPVRGFIDLNGPKEPNVLGRDLRSFSMDLSTRQIASVEAAEVVNPEGPVACQDGECCEQRYNTGDLQNGDACCTALRNEHGWDDVTLQYCCNASNATKDDACCQKLYSELGDGAPAQCSSCGAPNTDKANTVCCEEWGTSQVANNEEVMGLCCASLKGTDTSWSQLCCQPDEVSHTCCHANLGTGNGGKAASDASLRAYACECCKEPGWLYAGNGTWCSENCPSLSCQEPDSSRVSEACCIFWQDSGKLEKADGSVKNACCNIQGFRYYNNKFFADSKSPYCKTNTDYVCNNNLSWDVNTQYNTHGWGSIYPGGGPRLVKLNLNGEKMCRGLNVLKFIIDSRHRSPEPCPAGRIGCTGEFYADGTDCGTTVINNPCGGGYWDLDFVLDGIPNPTCRVYNKITGALVSEECRGSYLYQEKMYGYDYLYCYPNCP